MSGPAVVTCFERDSNCYWENDYWDENYQDDGHYPCKGTNGFSVDLEYDAAKNKFTMERFRFVKAVDWEGNFKTDIDFDYLFGNRTFPTV